MTQNVSRETLDRLTCYAALVRQWNPRINLVAPSTLAQLEARHIDDSMQIAQHADPGDGVWADLGSGGGLPGLILAAIYADRPARFCLVESDQRKAAFLRTAIREMGLPNATVIARRIEAVDPLNAADISVRALAPLPCLMPYMEMHLATQGQAWLMKGENWRQEVSEARKLWRFDLDHFPSRTHPAAAILKISGVSHV
ncbi:16S rRNA (guanine(527)-N(7))-methyltransferase RsmG [Paracoccus spongiarum]|uniref:Ribosomal RNA small subunit methyltransferase G n=1 Tax=Paracoccus spongiarum TaxID=3064387 RepID=A0ABT9JD38_9RHOB|nr:16S rRNA (guanine(527)-N(7))-methyltransferase RsmG [Paracoccus sp. 2205BS29-5]MDP5307022.1 16S rRNA (guanine(527)-N(7))-methyltransferase RsmG [Paracoccus sp. 2205BS29-5]